MDFESLVKSSGVLVAFLVTFILAGLQEMWVSGKTFRRVVDERDSLLELALRGTIGWGEAQEAALLLAEKGRR